jgi:hypothetical protein
MSRPRNLEPTVRLTLCLPASLRARLDAALERGGSVPVGAYQALFSVLVRDWLDRVDGREGRRSRGGRHR